MNGNEQQQIGALTAEVTNLKEEVSDLKKTIGEVRDTLVSLRGGWKFALILASVIGALIGYGLQFVQLFQHK